MDKYFRRLSNEQLINLRDYFRSGREILCGENYKFFAKDDKLWPAAACNTREVFPQGTLISSRANTKTEKQLIECEKWFYTLCDVFSNRVYMHSLTEYFHILQTNTHEDIKKAVNVVLKESDIELI